jgi:hypothetical protein
MADKTREQRLATALAIRLKRGLRIRKRFPLRAMLRRPKG